MATVIEKITKDKIIKDKKMKEPQPIEQPLEEQKLNYTHNIQEFTPEMMKLKQEKIKEKKPRKPMSIEQITILRERLAKGREINLAKKADQKKVNNERTEAMILLRSEQLKTKQEKFKEEIGLEEEIPETVVKPVPEIIVKPKRIIKQRVKTQIKTQVEKPVEKPVEKKQIKILFC